MHRAEPGQRQSEASRKHSPQSQEGERGGLRVLAPQQDRDGQGLETATRPLIYGWEALGRVVARVPTHSPSPAPTASLGTSNHKQGQSTAA